ncbi:MAG: DUF5683 domain-containing protein [Rudanella sp.]|nr:DUF5683 domain-containing protein [Rudanella sp.]
MRRNHLLMKAVGMKLLLKLTLLSGFMASQLALGQTVPAVPDTLRPTVNSAPAADSVRVGNSVLTVDNSAIDSLGATPLTKKQEVVRRTIIPRKATIKSLILPGLGQAYVGDYWKIPFVYAGLGASIYFLIDNNKQYLKYENAYRVAYNDNTKGKGNGTASVYIRGRKSEQQLGVAQLKQATSQFRGYRDLNVILTLAIWALNAVEANVTAHLKTFDLSDDISLRVQPNLHPTITGTSVPGVRLTFNFKK